PLVKVLTGIRRSGKSTVLKLLKEALGKKNIANDQIIHINLESFNYAHLTNASELYKFIKNNLENTKKYYLLLDEIQEVQEWEKAVNAFMVDFNVDIYITGSNSHLLSSELATHIAGRYIEIPIFTLSFAEYIDFRTHYFQEEKNTEKQFKAYLKCGGFPVVNIADYSLDSAYKIVHDIYSSVILRDTVQRYKIRDTELLERIIKFTFDNLGNTFSGKNVADYFKSQQRKIDINTVYNYLNALEGAFILYKVPRYDIRGKEVLKTQEKYYLSDVSLLYATMGFKTSMIAQLLENIVFLELKRRGYHVYIGKIDQKEIDFIAVRKDEKIYVQVAYKIESKATAEREFYMLSTVKDQYPKYVVTMDDFWNENLYGVKHMHIKDFLLAEKY
ncbi:MAG: ATP-binding protein, partial [Crocinitomicaceae bacterium]|nr:ATP-binding protein [Crocinitomicaceae bacterium]